MENRTEQELELLSKPSRPAFLRNDITDVVTGGDIQSTRMIVQPIMAAIATGTVIAIGIYLVTEKPIASVLAGVFTGATAGLETFIYTSENRVPYR